MIVGAKAIREPQRRAAEGSRQFARLHASLSGLSPFAPESAAVQAGRFMLQELARYSEAGQSFAFETALSGRSYANHIRAGEF